MLKKLQKNKNFILLIILLCSIFGLFLGIKPVLAAEEANPVMIGIVTVVGWIAFLISYVIGYIATIVIDVLIWVAQFNNIIGVDAVTKGWVIVRDLCNMFFILILLVVAFATILRIETYQWKKILPKLLIMAVLINFSKTICGLIIDFSQVIMLTFVNGFAETGTSRFVAMFQMQKYGSLSGVSDQALSGGSAMAVAAGIIMGLFAMIVSVIVISVMLAVLVMRIIMLWVYVILSPIAFLAAAFPAGQKYSSQWWGEFSKNVIVGPVLAFFIWLALLTAGTSSDDLSKSVGKLDAGVSGAGTYSSVRKEVTSPNALFSTNNFQNYIITLALLIGGLMVTQSMGGIAASIAGKGMAAIQKSGALAAKGGKKLAMGDNFMARKFTKATGVDWRPIKLAESWKTSRETARKKDETAIREKSKKNYEAGGARSVFAGVGVGEDYFNRYTEGFLGYKGIGRAAKEIAYNPFMRKSLGSNIDGIEKKIKAGEEKLVGVEPTIAFREQEKLSRDLDLNNIREKEIKVNDRLEELGDKKKLTSDEKREKQELEKQSQDLSKQYNDRTDKLKQEARAEFFATPEGKKLADVEANLKIDRESLKEFKDEIMKVQTPIAFEARSLYRKDVGEAKNKYKDITNAEELKKAFADAQQRGDKFDQIAIIEKLTNDSNLNEELRGKGYRSDAKGLHAYVFDKENDFGEHKGLKGNFSDKERLQIQNDLGEAAERVGHWDMAKMVGVNNKGEMISLVREMKNLGGTIKRDAEGHIEYDDMDHAMAAYAEVIKFDPQKIVNSMNRLSMGGEDGSGNFQIANLGKMIYKYLASSGAYEKNSGRILGNTAANLTSPNVIPILERLMENDIQKSNQTIALLKSRGLTKDSGVKPGEMAAWLRQSGI